MMSLLRLPKVLDRTGDSRSTLYQRIAEGLFPPPVRAGRRASMWPDYEVDLVLRARVAGRSELELRGLVARLIARRAEADSAPVSYGHERQSRDSC